jgi:predicted peroxiredoxin
MLWLASVVAAVVAVQMLGGVATTHAELQNVQTGTGLGGDATKAPMLFNITSGLEDPHSVTMAMQLANHALDDGRAVTLFFNVRGVEVAAKSCPDAAFGAEPLPAMLAKLVERGANVQVCPHCMKVRGIGEDDLVDGAEVTTREKLFGQLAGNTAVFSY